MASSINGREANDLLEKSDFEFNDSTDLNNSISEQSPMAWSSSPLASSSASMSKEGREAVRTHEMVLDLLKENVRLKAELAGTAAEKDRLNRALEEQKHEKDRQLEKRESQIATIQAQLHEMQEIRIKELQNRMHENVNARDEAKEIKKQLAETNELLKRRDKQIEEMSIVTNANMETLKEKENMEKIFRDEIEWLNEQLVQTNVEKETLRERIAVLERKNAEHERQQMRAREHDGEGTSTSMESNQDDVLITSMNMSVYVRNMAIGITKDALKIYGKSSSTYYDDIADHITQLLKKQLPDAAVWQCSIDAGFRTFTGTNTFAGNKGWEDEKWDSSCFMRYQIDGLNIHLSKQT